MHVAVGHMWLLKESHGCCCATESCRFISVNWQQLERRLLLAVLWVTSNSVRAVWLAITPHCRWIIYTASECTSHVILQHVFISRGSQLHWTSKYSHCDKYCCVAHVVVTDLSFCLQICRAIKVYFVRFLFSYFNCTVKHTSVSVKTWS